MLCQAYKDVTGRAWPIQNCSSTLESCCGQCDLRFCCNNTLMRLNQTMCSMTGSIKSTYSSDDSSGSSSTTSDY